MKNRNVSDAMFAGRISAHGKLSSLAQGFQLDSLLPFSIFVIPKASITDGVISTPDEAGLIVDCLLDQDESSAAVPILFNQWTECAIRKLAANAINLTTYDVYWGAGETINV